MNERIEKLAAECYQAPEFDYKKFAELIIEESCKSLNPMLRDMISRGQAVDLIKKHFGVE